VVQDVPSPARVAYGPLTTGHPMPRETMTPRERWKAVLRGEKPDRVSTDFWATAEAREKLFQHMGCTDVWELAKRLHIDLPVGIGPRQHTGRPSDEGCDIFGCRWKRVAHPGGAYMECIESPLAPYTSVEEIERSYTWPSPDDFDYSVISKQVEGKDEYPVSGGGSEPFWRYAYLRGQSLAYRDLYERPELAEYCLGKLFDFAYEMTARTYEQLPGRIDYSYIAEDLGTQEDLIFSPDIIRRFILPGMKKMMDLAHEAGVAVFTHSDGAVRKIIPDLIDAGMGVLNPVQWRCKGMDRAALKRDFGAKIVFHGAMDNQQTLPFGTVEDVRNEVLDNIRILGAGGGYILAPCHNIQVVSPPENIVTMYETAYEEGWY
jgi:uroporphyrinogen decarboxylase